MEYNFKLIDGELCCRICNTRVSVRTSTGWILKSNSEGDESKGICHECLVEHCVNTNCLGCDLYKYPNCPHIETKRIYLESQDDD
jgi:hypothetical protein